MREGLPALLANIRAVTEGATQWDPDYMAGPEARFAAALDPITVNLILDVVDVARRFVPDPATIQWESRETDLVRAFAALRSHLRSKP